MLENFDSDPFLNTDINDPRDIAGSLETLQLESFKLINRFPLACNKCGTFQTFKSNGVGGSPGKFGAKKLQITCGDCNSKTVYDNILSNTIQRYSEMQDAERTPEVISAHRLYTKAWADIKAANEPTPRARRTSSTPPASRQPSLLQFLNSKGITSDGRETPCKPKPTIPPVEKQKRPRESPLADMAQKKANTLEVDSASDPPASPADLALSQEITRLRAENQQYILGAEKVRHELAQVRAQMVSIQRNYELRIISLEERLAGAETTSRTTISRTTPAIPVPNSSSEDEESQNPEADLADAFPALPTAGSSASTSSSAPQSSIPGYNPIHAQDQAGASSATHKFVAKVSAVPTPRGVQSNLSYSSAAKKNAPWVSPKIRKIQHRAALSCITPQKPPMEVKKIQIRLHNSIRIDPKSVSYNKVLREVLKLVKIKNVILVSKIGNSVLEFYYPAQDDEDVRTKLTAANLPILEDTVSQVPTFGNGQRGKDFSAV
jgi:hypothetical protein